MTKTEQAVLIGAYRLRSRDSWRYGRGRDRWRVAVEVEDEGQPVRLSFTQETASRILALDVGQRFALVRHGEQHFLATEPIR